MGTISILMPVRNASEYLEECLESIARQTITDWELISVDDHSTDNSHEIVQKFAQSDSRVVSLKNRGKGIIDALNVAFENSSGKYITRMDADDIMIDSKLESMHKVLASHGNGYLTTGYVKYFNDEGLNLGFKKYEEWLNALTSKGENYNDIYRECTIPSPCWMVSREDLELAGTFGSHRYPEDYDLAFRFRKANLKILPIKKILHLWRDHPSRASRNDPNYQDNRFSEVKVFHFIDQDLNDAKPLILWGAGKKGKSVASVLLSHGIPFRWITNNKNKIGRLVYGVDVEGFSLMEKIQPSQVIIAISTFYKGEEVISLTNEFPGHQYFYFF